MNKDFRKILEDLHIQPRDLSFYRTAFTHRSILNERKDIKQSNERMEFLGDAVLSFVISSLFFKQKPNDTEGDLTNLRAYIIKTESLAKAAETLHLGRFLQLSRGEEQSGGRDSLQLLANTYEAVLGAIFLDLGIMYASRFIQKTLLPIFEQELKLGAPRDPKSELQEVAQHKLQVAPRYKIITTSGPDHAKKFSVGVFLNAKQIGQGKGSSKQQAEEEAAKQALTKLLR